MGSINIVILTVISILLGCTWIDSSTVRNMDRSNFVAISNEIPGIILDVKYFGSENFLGTNVKGYKIPECFLTKEAARALKGVQEEVLQYGLALKIFDCYRPQRAVDHFVSWAEDFSDTKMKKVYYPLIHKKDLIPLGYIADKSGHSRGSTVDLTLVEVKNKKELDMGTPFDFFDSLSNTADSRVQSIPQRNRLLLKSLMENHGFVNYDKEWWHFTLKNEPFPLTYFDFPIE